MTRRDHPLNIVAIDHRPTKRGGQEISLFEVLSHLSYYQHNISLAYLKKGELLDVYRKFNIRTIQIRGINIKNKLKLSEWFKFITSVIKLKINTKFDIIYINQIMDLPIAAVLKLFVILDFLL